MARGSPSVVHRDIEEGVGSLEKCRRCSLREEGSLLGSVDLSRVWSGTGLVEAAKGSDFNCCSRQVRRELRWNRRTRISRSGYLDRRPRESSV